MLIKKTVSRSDAGQRADRYIRKVCPGLGLSRLHFLFRKKEIKINGKPVPRAFQLHEGDGLAVYGLKEGECADKPAGTHTQKKPLDIPILYEDGELLVMDKPPGLAVHPGTGIAPGCSAIEKIHAYLGPGPDEVFTPSLVHRLDKDTSGVLMAAKTGEALRYWSGNWRRREIEKYYYALVLGIPPQKKGSLVSRLQRIDSKGGGAKSIDGEEGKTAETSFEIVEKFEECALLKVSLKTGRLHQIRAHLSGAGLPVLGDSRYGNFVANRSAKLNIGLNRIFLHAFLLRGVSADGGKRKFESPLPEDLKKCLVKLKAGTVFNAE